MIQLGNGLMVNGRRVGFGMEKLTFEKGVLNSLVILEAVLAHQKQFVNFWMSQVTFVPLVRALVTIFTGLNVVARYTPLLPRTVS